MQCTDQEMIDKFDSFKRTKGSVLIHFGTPYKFIELNESFVTEMQGYLKATTVLHKAGMGQPLTPLEKFALMVLDEAY